MATQTAIPNLTPDPYQAIAYLGRLIHERFFWFLLATCAVASCCPGPGLWLRGVSFGEVSLWGEKAPLSLPTFLLAFLLCSAGLGVQTAQLRRLLRDPKPLFAGLLANLAIPVVFLVGISQVMGGWHNADHVGSLLVGLALIASMPVAATSTLWSQNANGNLALSLGLVLLSTLLSPLTTPVVFQAVGLLAHGDYASVLHELGAQGAGAFLTVAVILPSALGLAGKGVLGEARVAPAKPLLKLVSIVPILTHTLVQQLVAGAAELVLVRTVRGGALAQATAIAARATCAGEATASPIPSLLPVG